MSTMDTRYKHKRIELLKKYVDVSLSGLRNSCPSSHAGFNHQLITYQLVGVLN